MKQKLVIVTLVFAMLPLFAFAQTPMPQAFTGTWKITRAVIGPWADPERPMDIGDEKERLMGQTITFKPKAVVGLKHLGCNAKPHYEIRPNDAPNMLFQGALEGTEYVTKIHADAADLARGLGMTTPTIPTLAGACEEIEFHMVQSDQLMFGLNNHVYYLERVK
ncbi:MAG: hypothetical protein LBV44_02300 [Methylobacillus sp.]|jgi:hypothetical protein|nr:hypothetical protein [Methylobacillus sp.]